MSQNDSGPLLNVLEGYLRQEGLYDLIPHARRPNVPFPFLYFLVVWGASAYLILMQSERHSEGWLAVLLFPGTTFAVLVILSLASAAAGFVPPAGSEAYNPGNPLHRHALRFQAAVFLLPPLINAPIIAWYARAGVLDMYLWTAGLMLGALVLMNLGFLARYRLVWLWSVVKGLFSLSRLSVGLLAALLPSILLVTLFPMFTRDLWEALAHLPDTRVTSIAALLLLPIVVLTAFRVSHVAREMVPAFPRLAEVAEELVKHRAVTEALADGTLEMSDVLAMVGELKWREHQALAKALLPVVRRRVALLITLLVAGSSFLLLLGFTAYFYLLFSALIPSEIIQAWSGLPQAGPVVIHLPWTRDLPLPPTAPVVFRVSGLLALFMMTISAAQLLVQKDVQDYYQGWMEEKSTDWLVAAAAYEAERLPGLQRLLQRTRGRVFRRRTEVVAAVPVATETSTVRDLCERLVAELPPVQQRVVRVFEGSMDPNAVAPSQGMWQLLVSRSMDGSVEERGFLEYSPLAAKPVSRTMLLGDAPPPIVRELFAVLVPDGVIVRMWVSRKASVTQVRRVLIDALTRVSTRFPQMRTYLLEAFREGETLASHSVTWSSGESRFADFDTRIGFTFETLSRFVAAAPPAGLSDAPPSPLRPHDADPPPARDARTGGAGDAPAEPGRADDALTPEPNGEPQAEANTPTAAPPPRADPPAPDASPQPQLRVTIADPGADALAASQPATIALPDAPATATSEPVGPREPGSGSEPGEGASRRS